MDVDQFKELPLLGILRGVDVNAVEPLAETIVSAGLRTIEITMNTPQAPDILRRMIDVAGSHLTIGAGTVLSLDDLNSALEAGASFIVLPTLVTDVVACCVEKGIPVFPGALTPQEIHTAWLSGATMVKVFPAKFFGPPYFREIKAPFQDVELLACGGVSQENLASFFACGASAAAFGASVFKPERIEAGEFDQIGEQLKALVTEYRTYNQTQRLF